VRPDVSSSTSTCRSSTASEWYPTSIQCRHRSSCL
jgi:hypothetical protein